jgi:hypothetical protein
MKHVVMFSGGVGSWAAAKRLAQQPEIDKITLLFADTMMEDEDLYRFLPEAVASIEKDATVEYVRIADGRDPWQVFIDVRFIGNSRVDPCSRILKRQLMDDWRKENCKPSKTISYLGIDWTEIHRLDRTRTRVPEWRYEAPMCEEPYLSKKQMIDWLKAEGIQPPRLYEMGFAHNNCGGFCIKAGQAQFRTLLRKMPDRYRYHEEKEQEVMAALGSEATILRNRKGEDSIPLSLKVFRERLQQQPDLFDKFDVGGCGCALD